MSVDILGPYAELKPKTEGADEVLAAWMWQYLRSRANSIEGGTTNILKNITAERVLGLPR